MIQWRVRVAAALCAMVAISAGCGESSIARRGVVNESDQDATIRVATASGSTQFDVASHSKAALPEASLSRGEVSLVAIFLGDCTLASVTYFAPNAGQTENSWSNGGSWRIAADSSVDDASESPPGWPIEWPAAQTSRSCIDAILPPAPPAPGIVPASP